MSTPTSSWGTFGSRVGGQRVTPTAENISDVEALFQPPPSERCVRVSRYIALQSLLIHRVNNARDRVSDKHYACLHPSRRLNDLCPFALHAAFPRSLVGRHPHDYYGHSVTLGLAPVRPSPVP